MVIRRKAGHAPKNTVTSPAKLANPGNPQPANIAIIRAAPTNGMRRNNPPSCLISSVSVCVRRYPLRAKLSAARNPCAIITSTAPVTPMRLKLAMPRKTKPMCATLE